jgi:transcriptional regulator with XRE-family HTH domain
LPRRTKADATAEAFGAAVRREREARGETLETVAGRIPRTGRGGGPITMDPKYLLSIEGGWHSPTVSTAKQIADALEVSLSDLFRRV